MGNQGPWYTYNQSIRLMTKYLYFPQFAEL